MQHQRMPVAEHVHPLLLPRVLHALQGGADGVALCLAPPGMQLLPDADVISDCPAGSYKEGWNLNPCASVSGS
jgi:hypothetical protein